MEAGLKIRGHPMNNRVTRNVVMEPQELLWQIRKGLRKLPPGGSANSSRSHVAV